MTIQGDISIDATATPMVINMEYLLKDNETGKVYWINNYVLLLTEGTDFVEVEIEGSAGSRFYDHDFGYVNLSTTDPFIIYLDPILEYIAKQPHASRLQTGEMVTTGTLTAALPIRPGQIWSTNLKGIALSGISVSFEE